MPQSHYPCDVRRKKEIVRFWVLVDICKIRTSFQLFLCVVTRATGLVRLSRLEIEHNSQGPRTELVSISYDIRRELERGSYQL